MAHTHSPGDLDHVDAGLTPPSTHLRSAFSMLRVAAVTQDFSQGDVDFIVINFNFLSAQDSIKKKVLILTTGGTIASQTNAPLIEGPELIQAVPELLTYADIEVEEFIRIGSSKMTP